MKKKIISRIISCALAFCVTGIGLGGLTAKKASAATEPVKLYWAQIDNYRGYDVNSGDISVQNLGFAKNVLVHYTIDGVNWSDLAAKYSKADPNNPGYEVWSFSLSGSGVPIKSFCIEYQVNNQTYWDNNGGSNYTFNGNHVILGDNNVKAVRYGTYSGIFVKNLGTDKQVGVRYTTDNWTTYQDVNTSYYFSQTNNIDAFEFPILPAGAKYAVFYTVNGNTYWDNNYGENYTY